MPNKYHRIALYQYLGNHYCNMVLLRCICWGLCPRSPLENMFSEDYVPDPVGAYVLRGICPRSMTRHLFSDNYVSFSTEACTFSVAIMTCSVVGLTRRVSRNRKETTTSIKPIKTTKKWHNRPAHAWSLLCT